MTRLPTQVRRFCALFCASVVALGVLLSFGGVAVAQPANPDAESDPPPESEASAESDLPAELDGQIQILGVDESDDRITLEIAVPPALGRLAPIADNFGVTDGGELVELTVSPVGTAADTVIVLDTSGSMRGSALNAAKDAASSFVQELPADARVGLISFGETVVTHRAPTLDRADVLAEIELLTASGDETVLWDALVVAAEVVGGAESGSSSVVVLSDGDDTNSSAAPAVVVGRLREGSMALYAVAIESPDTNLVALEEAVGQVGGQFLATTDIGQLASLYTDIAGRLANRYLLSFAPVEQGLRTIVVSVAAPGGVATASTTLGDPTVGPTAGTDPEPAPEEAATDPAQVLNVDDRPVLGVVTSPLPGRLADPLIRWIGLGSMFSALVLVGVLVSRPQAQVRLGAASGADRLGGINARMGQAVDRVITDHDRGRRIDARLEAADINLRPGEFVLAWSLLAGAAGMFCLALAGIPLAVVAVLGSAALGLVFLNIRASRRRSRFADQLTETLGIMASSLRSGQSLPRSIELVATEAPSPTAEEFHRISFEIRVGRDLTDSMRDASRRMASPDLEWLAQAVDINRELGGDLTEILDNVAATMRERRTVARQISALSAEGRATAWVLLSMPIVLFLFSWWRTPDSINALLTEPVGRLLLGIAVSGMALGYIWIRHLVKLKF